MKIEKVTKNDQKQLDMIKEASRMREAKIIQVYIETMRKKRSKE